MKLTFADLLNSSEPPRHIVRAGCASGRARRAGGGPPARGPSWFCWFWAFSLTFVAYVKAVGQLEALLAVALGIRLMCEHDLWRQLPGVGLTVVGIALVLLG